MATTYPLAACRYCGDDLTDSQASHERGACVECPVDPALVEMFARLIETNR